MIFFGNLCGILPPSLPHQLSPHASCKQRPHRVSRVVRLGVEAWRWFHGIDGRYALSYQKGKPLSSDFRRAIVLVKDYFDRNRREFRVKESSFDLAADALEVGVASVRRIVAANNKSPRLLDESMALRGRPPFSISGLHEQEVRSFVREANRSGTFVTLKSIRVYYFYYDAIVPKNRVFVKIA